LSTLKTVYIIVGPTAVGKTAFAIELAKRLGTEIISADARQCYQEMKIGVARPTLHELAQVNHYFIASHSIHDQVNAAVFEKYALEKVHEIFKTKNTVVMVGGTGLYIKAFCEGLDLIPEIDPQIRLAIQKEYELKGLKWLQEEIAIKDPLFWQQAEKENPQRLMRALEVIHGTGASILSFQNKQKVKRPFNIIKIGLEMQRPLLYERINERVLKMLEEGLEEEVKSLLPFFHLNALQTVGYSEWDAYFKGEMDQPRVIDLIQQHTRHYAKRQMTWFKKDPQVQWYNASAVTINQIIP